MPLRRLCLRVVAPVVGLVLAPALLAEDSRATMGDLCPWDLTHDGIVDTQDTVALLFDWGPCYAGAGHPPCPSDFNGDGVTDGLDLGELLIHCGPCPRANPRRLSMQWNRTTPAASAAGAALPATDIAPAALVELQTESFVCPFNPDVFVSRVYAVFGKPGLDRLQFVTTAPGALDYSISTNAPGGFFQHQVGTNTAPSEVILEIFPDLACDTFVTIGLVAVPEGETDDTVADLDFEFSTHHAVGGWFVYCGSPQAEPFNPDSFPGDGRLLIGQFSGEPGHSIWGTVRLYVIDSGIPTHVDMSFSTCPCDCEAGPDGHVDVGDFLALLAQWGGPGPCDCEDPPDGAVDVGDFLALLAAWGTCP